MPEVWNLSATISSSGLFVMHRPPAPYLVRYSVPGRTPLVSMKAGSISDPASLANGGCGAVLGPLGRFLNSRLRSVFDADIVSYPDPVPFPEIDESHSGSLCESFDGGRQLPQPFRICQVVTIPMI